ARTGEGTFVADNTLTADSHTAQVESVAATVRRSAPRISSSPPRPDAAIDLRSGRPDPLLFPLADWRRAVRQSVEAIPPGYGHRAGLPELRSAIAHWVARSRGVTVELDEILITAGTQQAIDLCARVMLSPTDVVTVEDPGYEPVHAAFEFAGATLDPVPVDDDGIDIDAINPRTRVVYVTPSHQSPTGVVLKRNRRVQLLELARNNGAVVIEDDYDTELRYVDRPLEPLWRLDPTRSVTYLGSFSKTLTPSLRIGFLIAPRAHIAELTYARALIDVQPPHLTQAALAHLISSGDFDRHLRRSRRSYQPRHAIVTDWIRRAEETGLIEHGYHSSAGLHATVRLHDCHDPSRIVTDLADCGIVIDVPDTRRSKRPRPHLVIGFGLANEQQLGQALYELKRTLEAS
ncbi:MAG: PLP-dependent aminotransferase family protein, partial [Ilumatobacteraceae bacterium]